MTIALFNWPYTLAKLGLWLLIPFLLGLLLGWFYWKCRRGAVSTTSSKEMTDSRTLIGKHETRINELQTAHTKDTDLIASLRGKVSSLEAAPTKTVEKLVDNPIHLSRISALEAEVAGMAALRSKITAFEAAPPKTVEKLVTVERIVDRPVEKVVTVEKIVDRPVEKIVEKLVDNPVHLRRVAELEAEVGQMAGLRSQINTLSSAPPKIVEKVVTVEKIVDRPVEKIVTVEKIVDRPIEKIVTIEKIVEKSVDNPANLTRIRELEAQVGEIAGLRSRISSFESAPAKTIEKTITVERQIDNPVHLARIRELEGELVRLRAAAKPAEVVYDAAAASAAFGVAIKQDDLKVVEGIGPKIEGLFHDAGIMTWRQLSQTEPARLKEILDAAGPRYQMHNPATWPTQSGLAADNKWAELKTMTDNLDAGRPE